MVFWFTTSYPRVRSFLLYKSWRICHMMNCLPKICGIPQHSYSPSCMGRRGARVKHFFTLMWNPSWLFSYCLGPLISWEGYVFWSIFMLSKSWREEAQRERWIGYDLLCLNWGFSLEIWFSWPFFRRYPTFSFIGEKMLIFFTLIIVNCMIRSRFEDIFRCIHIVDNKSII